MSVDFPILCQPDDTTCGPTCLHGLYRHWGDDLDLADVIRDVRQLEGGGTLAVLLANHALRRGYGVTIYTYNLQMFDPTWFVRPDMSMLRDRLLAQAQVKEDPKLRLATKGYVEFLDLGGQMRFQDLTPELIRRQLTHRTPILTGLSSTYLYHAMREYGPKLIDDAVRGEPQGHFVVLCGYDRTTRQVLVADPLLSNPLGRGNHYGVPMYRLIGAIFLGVLTYDANLTIIRRPRGRNGGSRVNPVRRQ
jgi:hypothetical protein